MRRPKKQKRPKTRDASNTEMRIRGKTKLLEIWKQTIREAKEQRSKEAEKEKNKEAEKQRRSNQKELKQNKQQIYIYIYSPSINGPP